MTSAEKMLEFAADAFATGAGRVLIQGTLVLAAAWLIERCFTRLSPRQRSWLWRAALLKTLLAAAFPAALALAWLPAHPNAFDQTSSDANDPGAQAKTADRPSAEAISQAPMSRATMSPASQAAGTTGGWTLLARGETIGLMLWTLGVTASLCVAWLQWQRIDAVRRRALPWPWPKIEADYAILARRLNVADAPPLRRTPGDGSPMLVGLLRPVILLPTEFAATAPRDEVQMALAHELAHYRRRDLAWNLLTRLAASVAFFHPLVWLAVRRLQLAQELACDEMALGRLPYPLSRYGALLLRVAESAQRRGGVMARAAAAAGPYATLRERIGALPLLRNARPRTALSWSAAAVLLVAMIPLGLARKDATFAAGDALPGDKAVANAPANDSPVDNAPASDPPPGDASSSDESDPAETAEAHAEARARETTEPAGAGGYSRAKAFASSSTSATGAATAEDEQPGNNKTGKSVQHSQSERRMSVSVNGQRIDFEETRPGQVVLRVTQDGAKNGPVKEYRANTLEELKAREPEGYALYEKQFARPALAPRIKALPPGATPDDLRRFVEEFLKDPFGKLEKADPN